MASYLVFSLKAYSVYSNAESARVINIKVVSTDTFIRFFERDISYGGQVALHRAVETLIIEIDQNGYLSASTAEGLLAELIEYGTLSSTPKILMENHTIVNWVDKLKINSENMNINLAYDIVSVKVNQSNPWYLDLHLHLKLNVSDYENTSKWIKDYTILTQLPVNGLKDPFYVEETNGAINQTIQQSISEGDYGNTTDHSPFLTHLEDGRYAIFDDAPSYIQRLEGDFTTGSDYGIESIINKSRLSDTGSTISNVDYLYWPSTATNAVTIKTGGSCDIFPSWLFLDTDQTNTSGVNHKQKYNVVDC